MGKEEKNNHVWLTGTIISMPEYSHEAYGEKFYNLMFGVERLSGVKDVIPLMVSESLIDVSNDNCIGVTASVYGTFRSFNKHEETKSHLVLYVFVHDIDEASGKDADMNDCNLIKLEGFVCKDPVYRKTPLGRELTEILIAVNRSYGKSDYIPCITWGRKARLAAELKVGTLVSVEGRIQSREYTKKVNERETEQHIAYEVSAHRVEVIKDVD